MSYKEFAKDLKNNNLNNLVFVYGAENLLIRWCMNALIDKYAGKEFREENVMDYAGDSISIDDVIGKALTPSMFPGKRVIIVRNLPMLYKKTADSLVKSEGERLLDFARRRDLDTYIVLILDSENRGNITAYGKKVIKAASSYECDRLTMAEMRGFIQKRIKNGGKFIGDRQLGHLIDLCGYFNKESEYSLDELDNDLSKLVNAAEGTDIDNALIEDLMIKEIDLFIFHFIDALVANNKGRAMELVIAMLNKDEKRVMPLLATISSQFEMMYDAKQLEEMRYSIKDMAKALGVNEYRFKKAFQAAGKFSQRKLKEILLNLYDVDSLIKTGVMNPVLALETFVLSI